MGNAQSYIGKVSGDMKRVSLITNGSSKPAEKDPMNIMKGELYNEGKAYQLLEEHGRAMEQRDTMDQLLNTTGNPFVVRNNIGKRIATLGSQENIFVHSNGGDIGFFASVLTAYNYHWALRMTPDDWWFCVIRKVAKAIDKNSKKESVRKLFVNHEGQKTLTVTVNSLSIYGIDYGWFFDEMSRQISENIKVPDYVDAVTADFSTTTAVQRIVSQVTLMSSVQELFDFRCQTMCGIPVAEMLGTEEDWARLQTKLKILKTQLEPIKDDIGLTDKWWAVAKNVFVKLLDTYRGHPDKSWWSHIMSYKTPFKSGGRVGWEGWIVDFLVGPGSRINTRAFTSGLVTVPLTFVDPIGTTDTAALVAGMLGFKVHQDKPDRPSVQPFQGWSLLLHQDSPFRRPMEE